MTVRIDMLPAAHGDCLWIEWPGDGTTHRMLIDAGPAHTYPHLLERIDRLPADERRFELLVVTHIDADHIDGVVRLLRDAEALGVEFARVWYNGREQLDALPDRVGDTLGAVSGEYVQLLLHDLEERAGRVWNIEFADRDGIAYCDPSSGDFPHVTMPGGLTLTLVSPDLDRLHDLDEHWEEELAKERVPTGDRAALLERLEGDRRLRPLADELGGGHELADEIADDLDRFPFDPLEPVDGDLDVPLADELGGGAGDDLEFGADPSPANGSSIALLAEWEDGPTVLLAGDAFAGVLQASIEALLGTEQRLQLDAFKLPHHGSVSNVTAALLDLLACRAYLVSTSGVQFGHPHRRAVDLIVEHHQHRAKPRFVFNHRSETTAPYESGDIAGRRCDVVYPEGVSVKL